LGVAALGAVVGALQACATDVTVVEDEDSGTTQADASKSDANTARPDATPARDSSTPDARPVDSSVPDTSVVDAADSAVTPRPGDPFDPLAPATGANCPAGVMENDVITRRCGKCGQQSALCETGRKVGAYGACSGEKTNADACLPNEVLVSECGFCGQQTTRCDLNCAAVTGACTNQVPSGCVKNEVTYIDGICPTAAETRRQVCSATCTKGAPEPCAARPVEEIVVSQTVGATVNGGFLTTSNLKIPLLSGSCPATESTMVSSLYHWVRLRNAGADEVTVTLTNGIPSGGSRPAVTFTGFAGSTVPADRKACSIPPYTTSIETLRMAIPAGGSVMVLTQLDSSGAPQARLSLDVKTDLVGPEVPPAIDHIVEIGAAANDVVTQAVTFVSTQTGPRISTFSCPTSFTSTTNYGYRYLRLDNPTAMAKTVDIAGDAAQDTVISVYPGATAPTSTTRTACIGTANDTCANVAFDSCVNGISVPANGSVVVLFAPYFSSSYFSTTLSVTTKN